MFLCSGSSCFFYFIIFFFNDTATTEIYTLSLHDALPIYTCRSFKNLIRGNRCISKQVRDRKSTRLNSSHTVISYAVFCLKKKKITKYCRKLNKKHNIKDKLKQYNYHK